MKIIKIWEIFPSLRTLTLKPTMSTTSRNHLEDEEMYPISYSLIFAFHTKFQLDKIVIVRSFNHFLEQLNDVSYVTDKMLRDFDPKTARQLKDCAESVFLFKKTNLR